MQPQISPYTPTDEDRKLVQWMSAARIKIDDMPAMLRAQGSGADVHPRTFRAVFADDLVVGRVRANLAVARKVYAAATTKWTNPLTLRAAEIWAKHYGSTDVGQIASSEQDADQDEARRALASKIDRFTRPGSPTVVPIKPDGTRG